MTLRASRIVAILAALAAAAPLGSLAAQAAAPAALILAPEPGERVPADQLLVAVTLPPGADSVSVRVGARDVTAEAVVEGGVLTWRPREPLASGPHRVVVAARGAEPVAWTFTVAPAPRAAAAATPATPARRRSPAIPHGSVVMEGGGNAVTGPGADLSREREFLPQLWLTAGGELRPGWRYTARAYVSGYESADQQPVNRFRADLRTPALSLAWKLLWLATDTYPQGKDLYDATLLAEYPDVPVDDATRDLFAGIRPDGGEPGADRPATDRFEPRAILALPVDWDNFHHSQPAEVGDVEDWQHRLALAMLRWFPGRG